MKRCPVCTTSYPDAVTSCPVDRAPLVTSPELDPGTLVNNTYEIVRTIGEGGFGIVYLARLLSTGAPRALKFLSPQIAHDPKVLKRFRQEACVEIIHPNVVRIYDSGYASDGAPFISLEYVDGPDLRQLIDHGPPGIDRTLALARGIALGLDAAHSLHVLHRDIKPENVLVSQQNAQETPKILDFGIAAVRDSVTHISRTRGLMLTPEYAAPEQWEGMPANEMDARVDLYAFGGLLYELLTGQRCFPCDTNSGWMYQHLHGARTPPSRLRPELTQWRGLDDLVIGLLSRDRNSRPRDAKELIRQLDALNRRPLNYTPTQVQDVSSSAAKRPLAASVPPKTRSNFLPIAIGAAVVVLTATGYFVSKSPSVQDTPVPPKTERADPGPALVTKPTTSASVHPPVNPPQPGATDSPKVPSGVRTISDNDPGPPISQRKEQPYKGIDPAVITTLENTADGQKRDGFDAAALATWQQILQMDPNNPRAGGEVDLIRRECKGGVCPGIN
jgi:serine/threonine protein kinase